MLIHIDDTKINDLQVDTIIALLVAAKQMSHGDVLMRCNGEEYGFQADWLKYAEITHMDISKYKIRDRPTPTGSEALTPTPTEE